MWFFNLLFIGFLNLSHAGGDGSLIGNGGNTVFCKPQGNSDFQGFYTLDYLLDFHTSGPYSNLVQITNWDESKLRIEKGLLRLSPLLAKSFQEYTKNILMNQSHAGRIWLPWDLTDTLIDDQEITQRLPDNCYRNQNKPDLHQTVVRSYGARNVEYRYQKDILENLRKQSPLQFSFFIVHEWLWDFTQDVRSLRRLNWILHSTEFENLDLEMWKNFSERTHFFNRQLPVCHRSPAIQDQIVKLIGKSCENILLTDLTNIQSLDLSSLPTNYIFRSGDFSGFLALRTLSLRNNPNILDQLPPYAFTDLINLEIIYNDGSGFNKFPDHLLEGPRRVRLIP